MDSQVILNDLRKRLYQCTELRAEAIDEVDRRRWLVDVYEGEDDPIHEIIDKITWSESGATCMGLAGGAGVGKTTQIYRLIEELRRRSIIGVRIGFDEYSSLSSPPDITDFLLTVVGALAEEGRKLGHLSPDWSEESVQSRLMGLLRRLKFEPEFAAGPVTVTASLREDDSFRQKLRTHLAGQVAQLVREVRDFATSIVKGMTANAQVCLGVVMIVDSTERLSAPASADADMQAAVRSLFIQNGENLAFDDLHSVYLLPPWLPITDGGALRLDTVIFPTVRVARRDGSDEEAGLNLLDEIVHKRMPNI
jgi:hypothetical protein